MNTELKIRARNEEMLTGVNISRERDVESTLQINPSCVKNLVEYQKFLRSQLSSLGEEVAYRPVPSQVSSYIHSKHLTTRCTADLFCVFFSFER